ncbi:MAG: class I SAM-dependent methyltransferase [Acidobacteria bacterium]|jgi:cephalosporin hydroxylase|nr:class I SAM-dependent methyltransferase [Acidobacteriota bacterium]
MKITIDTDKQNIIDEESGEMTALYSTEGFELISDIWLKVGWNEKYVYTFSWLGRPVIQLPEDMIRAQEVIFRIKPDVIIETGVAHGGSLIFNASLLKAMDIEGRVIGIDIEIRPHNRKAIKEHFLFPYITLIEGSSTAPEIVAQVKSLVKPNETVLVILDSNHSYDHVLEELEAYHDLVSRNSYIVATDGSMRVLHDVPRGEKEWLTDNPANAAEDFAKTHPEFVIEQPAWDFNESALSRNITHWTSAWLRRK